MDTNYLPYSNTTNYITWTSPSSTTNYIVNYNYNGYATNNIIMDEIYDFKFSYSDTIEGLKNYIFANDLITETIYIMENIYYESEDPQKFEDDIYYTVLDLLYTLVNQDTEKSNFKSMLFDKYKYPDFELDIIINKIIKRFHNLLLKKESC